MKTLKMNLLFVAGFLAMVSFIPSHVSSKTPAKGTKWITLTEAQQNFSRQKRPILIDLYTDWCGWCKVMDKKTYANPDVAAYLEKHFYSVKFDAEGKLPIRFNGREFSFNQQYKTHDFAIALTEGNLSYPTTVIIPGDGSKPQVIPGYLQPQDFEKILKYFGEGKFGKQPFQEYEKSFKGSWKN